LLKNPQTVSFASVNCAIEAGEKTARLKKAKAAQNCPDIKLLLRAAKGELNFICVFLS
jgi:hypothetical protein